MKTRVFQKKYPEREQLVSILPFESGHIRLLRDKEFISEVQDLRPEEYNPCAGTLRLMESCSRCSTSWN